METQPEWGLLGIVIALAAYIATVRARILDKAANAAEAQRPRLYRAARTLMWADVPLVVAGLTLGLHNLLLAGGYAPCALLAPVGLIAAGLALLVLAVLHANEWYKSFAKPA